MEALQDRWERLLGRLLDGAVVPFLGAGISSAARVPDCSLEPRVGWMCERLRREIDRDLKPEDPPDEGDPALILWVLRHCDDSPSLARLAELGSLLWGPRKVCEILQIERFADLEPLPAHRYLAYLAREGLITEIFSTNHDCCIETAFDESFGDVAPPHRSEVAVIRSLDEYRQSDHDHPDLTLYKINGCAREYREAGDRASRSPSSEHSNDLDLAAERIILTERQLQNFRKEHWVEDLFRDRARRRNLLFCGFGSEEPQVRHAALSLMAEFQRDGGGRFSPTKAARLPNAPFLVAHEYPSFYQLQILTAYFKAHCGPCGCGSGAGEVASPLLQNVFMGTDAPGLRSRDGEDGETRLDADLFFRRLFEDAFCRLLRKEIGEGSVFYQWLRKLTPHVRTWLGPLRSLGEESGPSEGGRDASPSVEELLAPNGTCGPLALWRWLWAMRYPARAEEPLRDWYLPLVQEPLVILVTILVLRILSERKLDLLELRPVRDLGLQLLISQGSGGATPARREEPCHPRTAASDRTTLYYLVTDGTRAGRWSTGKGRLVRRLAVPSFYRMDPIEQVIDQCPKSTRVPVARLWVSRCETVSVEDVVRAAEGPKDFAQVLPQVYAGNRPRYRARLKKLRSPLRCPHDN